MLTLQDKLKLALGYLGIRVNGATIAEAQDWLERARGYYRLYNSCASEEVLNQYNKDNFNV